MLRRGAATTKRWTPADARTACQASRRRRRPRTTRSAPRSPHSGQQRSASSRRSARRGVSDGADWPSTPRQIGGSAQPALSATRDAADGLYTARTAARSPVDKYGPSAPASLTGACSQARSNAIVEVPMRTQRLEAGRPTPWSVSGRRRRAGDCRPARRRATEGRLARHHRRRHVDPLLAARSDQRLELQHAARWRGSGTARCRRASRSATSTARPADLRRRHADHDLGPAAHGRRRWIRRPARRCGRSRSP